MKRYALAVAFAGFMLALSGCAVYVPPYDHVGVYYHYAPYGGYAPRFYGSYGYRPYFYGPYGYRPRYYGGAVRGYGWRGYGRR